ncbi:hypothetical protein Aperf_G00000115327 [Anoplocephala perfoliata]
MADNSNCSIQSQVNRVTKGSSFQGKRGETPDSSANAQRNMSPGQNSNVNSRPPTLPNNHHQGPQQQYYSNHRIYNQRGRNRDGGFYGSQGSHNSGPNRRFSPGPPVPNASELAAYMNSAWEEFKKMYKESRGEDLQDEISLNSPVTTPHPMTPMSPRISGHVNSPHRGQHSRYSHQNSAGSNWSMNNGGNGRRYPENGEHSNTGSLRRHRGAGHNVSSGMSNNQSWQRGNFINRQNSPNNTLYRQGPRHPMHSRSVVSPTSPPAMSNISPTNNSPTPQEPAGQAASTAAVTDMMQSLNVKSHSTVENVPQKPPAPNNGGSNGNKNSVDGMSAADQYFTPEPPSSPSSISAGVKTTGSPTPTNDR